MGRAFQFEELEPQLLKGFSLPVKTFLVCGYEELKSLKQAFLANFGKFPLMIGIAF